MMNNFFCVLCFFVTICSYAQTKYEEFRSKKIKVTNDTVRIDSVSIRPDNFKVFTFKGSEIPKTEYQVDFGLSLLVLNGEKYPEIILEYYRYPEFITKTYVPFDKKLIVESAQNTGKLFSETTNKKIKDSKLFEGLETQGFITRGLTSGNNQNAVTNSTLDLTISGKLSDKVSIRANIFDTNFPLQQSGYSQNITDFDRILLELYSDKWNVKGGDIILSNKKSYFLNFDKQVSGVALGAKLNKDTKVRASGAIVRGKFSIFNFIGVEANQGPYKIFGPNNQSAIIIIEGSEQVFVNGISVQRGEDKDYMIDYNLGEIQFNTKYPITNDMRIRVEFQYADRNYTRFISFGMSEYKNNSFEISGFFYNENDAKNHPIQQSLSNIQKQVLANAGNDKTKMSTSSALPDKFSPDKVQYKKVMINRKEVFEYITNEINEVYTVSFTNVGKNKGDYQVDKIIAKGTIYKYVGNNLGSFSPVNQLIAPNKLQVAVVNSTYKPSERISLSGELAFSNYDQNLFSELDDQQNRKVATKFGWEQQIMNKSWNISSGLNFKFIQNNFQTVQRFQAIEFNRDWNLENRVGDQYELGANLTFDNKKNTTLNYDFQYLTFSNNFSGNKHSIKANINKKKTNFWLIGSWLSNTTNLRDDNFYRLKSKIAKRSEESHWGGLINFESNSRKRTNTNNLDKLSHRFYEVEGFYGIGDSSKVYSKIGVNYRVNDSIRANIFTQINNRKTIYVNSTLVQNETTNISAFANYRITKNKYKENEEAVNSKIAYNQHFFRNFLSIGASYETTSGNIARQDFMYIKTEPGQGYYTWIDYNNDEEQQFNEFEVAQFQDQATYLRVALPNVRFTPTHKVKWKQIITVNPGLWKTRKGIRKIVSYLFNQTYITIDNEKLREKGEFHWNPFQIKEDQLLGLIYNIRNNFYFNRSLQRYSWIYSYGKSRNKQQFSIGTQENNSVIHQLEFQHKFAKDWLFEAKGAISEDQLLTQNLTNRNYTIHMKEFQPKWTFFYNKNRRFSFFYHLKDKQNTEQNFEKLKLQKLGVSYFFMSQKKNQLTADFTMFINNFKGNSNSPIGYQMLEGLQVGKNYTWNLLWNQKLTSILNLSLNYFGRKSEDSPIIHSGTIQLKAIF